MIAIYKRELHSYYSSITGYLVMAAMLLFVGIYYVYINLTYGYASFAMTLGSVSFIFTIIIPILTMRSFSEDRKNKTDQLLLTSPVSITGVVLGKYLAMVTVFGLVCLICCVFPLLLHTLGSGATMISYLMLLAFFLFGCAAIAIGTFISALTESQILACVGTLGVMIMLELLKSLSELYSEDAWVSLLGLLVIVLLFAYLIMTMTANGALFLVVAFLGCGTLGGLFLYKSSLFENLVPDLMSSLSITDRLTNFSNGILDLTALVFYVTVIFVFIFLTIMSIEKRRWSH